MHPQYCRQIPGYLSMDNTGKNPVNGILFTVQHTGWNGEKNYQREMNPSFFLQRPHCNIRNILWNWKKSYLSSAWLSFSFFPDQAPSLPQPQSRHFMQWFFQNEEKLGRKNKVLFPSRSKNRHIISTRKKIKKNRDWKIVKDICVLSGCFFAKQYSTTRKHRIDTQ